MLDSSCGASVESETKTAAATTTTATATFIDLIQAHSCAMHDARAVEK